VTQETLWAFAASSTWLSRLIISPSGTVLAQGRVLHLQQRRGDDISGTYVDLQHAGIGPTSSSDTRTP
jgi:hypothetical protein